jgi:hypothetical protein
MAFQKQLIAHCLIVGFGLGKMAVNFPCAKAGALGYRVFCNTEPARVSVAHSSR